MSTTLNVAAIQMVSCHDVDKNLTTAKEMLQIAAEKNAQLAVLPETFLTYGIKNKPDVKQQEYFLATMADFAKELNLWVIAGTYPLSEEVISPKDNETNNNKPFAGSTVFNNNGVCEGIYSKVHLFDADVNDGTKRYRESDEYRHGADVPVFKSPWCDFGVAVCYDLRFPELFTYFHGKGCAMICLPSAFTEATGRDHWQVLVRARAIETQSYIVAANQGGTHPSGRATWGESMIVDPWGVVLAKIDKGEGVIVKPIDFNCVDQIRKKMPVAQHRRLI